MSNDVVGECSRRALPICGEDQRLKGTRHHDRLPSETCVVNLPSAFLSDHGDQHFKNFRRAARNQPSPGDSGHNLSVGTSEGFWPRRRLR